MIAALFRAFLLAEPRLPTPTVPRCLGCGRDAGALVCQRCSSGG